MNVSAQTDQVSRLLDTSVHDPEVPDDGESPLMPFPTSYILPRDREEELVDYALTRMEELETECGRNYASKGEWWGDSFSGGADPQGVDKPQETWLGKRQLYDKMFKNEVDWRPRVLGGIFAESNLVIPAARRICRQMIARAVNYFFGSSPWFAVYPVGDNDKDRADKADRYIKHKTDKAHLQRAEEQAIERAFIIGEGILKASWNRREQIYKTRATVLVDEEGNDILGEDGDFITQKDLWVPEVTIDEVTGEAVQSDLMVLKRDGKTIKPEVEIWQEKLVTRRMVHYKGPKSELVNFIDFLCPLTAPSVQEADCVVHFYDRPLMDLADAWMKALPEDATAVERQEAMRRAIEMLRRISGSGEAGSAQDSDAVDSSTLAGRGSSTNSRPVVKLAEFFIQYDADGDGILEDVFLLVDLESKTPVFYDYVANVTADGQRPFSVVRVNEVPGRWYGMGAMEMNDPLQRVLDLWMNRKNKAVSGSGSVTFWDPSATIEGRSNPNLELGDGETYTLCPGKKAEDALQRVQLDDVIGDKITEMMEFVMQVMLNESGVANANDGNVAGMESTELATGIRNIEKSGQELFSLFLGHLEPGLSDALSKVVAIIFAYLDEMEVYRYFEEGEGGEGAGDFVEIDPNDIANLELDTKILMTRHRGEQVIESNIRIIQLVKEFDSFTYERQITVRDTFIAMAKALQATNAEKLFTPLNVIPPGNGMPPAKETASAASKPPRKSEANL